jgi:hypothetical protein
LREHGLIQPAAAFEVLVDDPVLEVARAMSA